ncbi:transglutaminase-like domain-containing protein [Kribbella sp. NPDC055110]
MSGLVATEAGRVVATLGEEVNGRRHARSRLDLDAGAETLYVLARSHRPDGPPLEVHVGDTPVGAIPATNDHVLTWRELVLPAGARTGPVTLSSYGNAMDAWTVGVDYTTGGGDELSIDAGGTWSADRIGHLHLAPGRYVVRARVEGVDDPHPPAHVWEDVEHPAVREFLGQLPAEALQSSDPLATAQALSTWVCRSWRYRNTSEASQYTPWDPPTILSWGASEQGHAGNLPVVMCVHYALVLTAACQALGIPARCAVLTGSINGYDGHFVSEVWSERLGRWVMLDPTFDVAVVTPDGPADLRTIRDLGTDVRHHVVAGPGIEDRLMMPSQRTWFEENLLKGVCFRNRSLWPRSDFLSRPDLTPPGHGSASYTELDLVWEDRCRDTGFGMFQYFAGDDWFKAPPAVWAKVAADAR